MLVLIYIFEDVVSQVSFVLCLWGCRLSIYSFFICSRMLSLKLVFIYVFEDVVT